MYNRCEICTNRGDSLSKLKRMDWDNYFGYIALLASNRATCDRLKVGAVIVKDKQIIATGYNGGISGIDDHCIEVGCLMRDGHCVRTEHAEKNALNQCAKQGSNVKDATLYVTHFPCLSCTKSLLNSGIKEICYINNYNNDEYARKLIKAKGINVRKINLDPYFTNELFTQVNATLELNK